MTRNQGVLSYLAVFGIISLCYSGDVLRAENDIFDRNAVEKAKSIDELLALMVPALRKQLPMKVDERTTWVSVTSIGPMLGYVYRIDAPKQELLANQVDQQIRYSTTHNVCGRKSTKMLLAAGGTLRFYLKDEIGLDVVSFDVKSSSC